MVILFVFTGILAALIAAVFIAPVGIDFLFDTVAASVSLRARWLGVVRGEGTAAGGHIHLTLRLFSARLYAGPLRPKRGADSFSLRALLNAAVLSDIRIRFSYGSDEPHLTGYFCAAGEFLRTLLAQLPTADVVIEPEFLPQEEFLTVAARARLNAGRTLWNLLKMRFHIKKPRRRHRYGSA